MFAADGNLPGMRFETIDTPDSAYWLGFIAADGGVMGNTLRVGLARRDIAHLQCLAEFLGTPPPVEYLARCQTKDDVECARLDVRDRALVAALFRLGIEENKTWTVRPWHGPARLMPHYWRGVVDGDGWVARRRVMYRGQESYQGDVGLCGNKAMVEGFRDFVEATTGHRGTVLPNKSIWCVKYGGIRKAQDVARVLYGLADGPRLQRKVETAQWILSQQPKTRRWTLTAADLQDLAAANDNNWARVAEHLKVLPAQLRVMRRRAGLPLNATGRPRSAA